MENKIKGINFAEKRKAFCRVDYVTREENGKDGKSSTAFHFFFWWFSAKVKFYEVAEEYETISQSNVTSQRFKLFHETFLTIFMSAWSVKILKQSDFCLFKA